MEENEEVKFKDVKRKIIFANSGALIGFFIVKAFIFNATEDLGWHFFWATLFEGNISFSGLTEIITTSGFIKLAIGTVVGFKIGEWIENGTIKKYIDDLNEEEENDNSKT